MPQTNGNWICNLRKHAADLLDNLILASVRIVEVQSRGPVCGLVLRDTAGCAITTGEVVGGGTLAEACCRSMLGAFKIKLKRSLRLHV